MIYLTLERWANDEPSAVEPLRWLALLRSHPEALKGALALAPDDIPVHRRLVNASLAAADYATHHLSESVLLSTVEETRASIATAQQWIAAAPGVRAFADQGAEAENYKRMVDDWVAYSQSPNGTFPQGCEARGRTYSWPTIIYYEYR